jgi:hypothetical protein
MAAKLWGRRGNASGNLPRQLCPSEITQIVEQSSQVRKYIGVARICNRSLYKRIDQWLQNRLLQPDFVEASPSCDLAL